ncbi:hypothetical protein NM688_g4059 [Phlebia brevispora]|uniref:Uncharacterized protein n=1 Tax=Phlebia brevispora TaxID=194682 RepID=A0ACC1T3Z5_9APHY|nr:hypothetical protein NM688_g4059 [Phlebia brevispora]
MISWTVAAAFHAITMEFGWAETDSSLQRIHERRMSMPGAQGHHPRSHSVSYRPFARNTPEMLLTGRRLIMIASYRWLIYELLLFLTITICYAQGTTFECFSTGVSAVDCSSFQNVFCEQASTFSIASPESVNECFPLPLGTARCDFVAWYGNANSSEPEASPDEALCNQLLPFLLEFCEFGGSAFIDGDAFIYSIQGNNGTMRRTVTALAENNCSSLSSPATTSTRCAVSTPMLAVPHYLLTNIVLFALTVLPCAAQIFNVTVGCFDSGVQMLVSGIDIANFCAASALISLTEQQSAATCFNSDPAPAGGAHRKAVLFAIYCRYTHGTPPINAVDFKVWAGATNSNSPPSTPSETTCLDTLKGIINICPFGGSGITGGDTLVYSVHLDVGTCGSATALPNPE